MKINKLNLWLVLLCLSYFFSMVASAEDTETVIEDNPIIYTEDTDTYESIDCDEDDCDVEEDYD